ncbi:MAG: hypothetical protein IT330_03100 [Anaerolineae bacterium]|nr:hypothetical protein [Anaerolineae bacterium]
MNDEPEPTNEEPGAEPEEEDEFPWEEWLLEGGRGLRLLARDCGVPDEFWQHLHSAQKEALAAGSVLLLAALRGQLGSGLLRMMRRAASMDTSSSETSPQRATRIQVE